MDQERPEPSKESSFDFTKSRSQMLAIEAVRLGFHLVILIITLAFQSAQPDFVNVEILYPVYILLAASFAINVLYLFFFETALKLWPTTAFLFFFDTIFVTTLIHATGVSQSIFFFLYLVNIILCGLVFQRRGAIALGIWTTVLFSVLMILQTEVKGQTLYFAFGMNILAFFAVAGLSGFLSEQLNFMGSELSARRKDLAKLTDLNNLIIENIATGLMTTNRNGQIVQVNRAGEEILARGGPVLGVDIQKIFPGFLERASYLWQSEDSPGNAHIEVQYINHRDEKLILEMIVSLLKNSNNEFDGYILIFQDLTKVRRLEFAMRQSEKLAAVGQLAAGIAHEIRNPLAGISGSVQLLRQMVQDPSNEQARLMNIILKEIDRLNALITEFLEFVRPDIQSYRPVHINDIIKEVTDMARVSQSLRKDVVQNLELRAQRPISGNFDKLKQALLNIVINAYQAMDKIENPQITISTKDRDQTVVVKVRDNGTGIDEKNLKRIFEPFHTTKPKGTGLGLAVTHKILDSHGAKVFVESTLNQGTEFTLEFPAEKISKDTSFDQAPLRKANE